MDMTQQQMQILQHALGLDEYGKVRYFLNGREYYGFMPTRNHFCAGGEDETVCRELVALGLMRLWPNADESGRVEGYPYYNCSVTDVGKEAVREHSPQPPKLTRSQIRYRRYLRIADLFDNFREFLAHDKAVRAERRSWSGYVIFG